MKASTIITAIVAASALLSAPAAATQRGLKADNSNKNENAAGKNSDECRELAEWVAGRVVPSVEFFLENVSKEVIASDNVELKIRIVYLLKYIKEQANALALVPYRVRNFYIHRTALLGSEETATISLGDGKTLIDLLEAAYEKYCPNAASCRSVPQQLKVLLRFYLEDYRSIYGGTPEEGEVLSYVILFSSAVVLTLLSGLAAACGGPAQGSGPVRRGDAKDVMGEHLLEIAADEAIFGLAQNRFLDLSLIVFGFTGTNITESSLVGAEAFIDRFLQ